MMTRELKAHGAYYAGIPFRSRLEACWAAFFQAHHMYWEYEKRAFEFDDGTRYLPDFWLPDSRAWFEVKGRMSDEDKAKCLKMAAHAGPRDELMLLGGSPAGMVFAELTEAGEVNFGAQFVRCHHCDSWTFSMALCRYCGHHGHPGPFIDTITASIHSNAWIWQGEQPLQVKPDDIRRQWAAEGQARLMEGFPAINTREFYL